MTSKAIDDVPDDVEDFFNSYPTAVVFITGIICPLLFIIKGILIYIWSTKGGLGSHLSSYGLVIFLLTVIRDLKKEFITSLSVTLLEIGLL